MMESLAYEMHEGKGPPVLLVHGAMGTRLAWGLNIDAFRKVASPVVVELWGHGRSPVPSGISAYLVAEYVAQFEKMRRDMGVKTWLTIGVSTGGSLALQYALTHPEAVAGVVFTNDVSALGTEAERETMMARRNLLIPELSGPNGDRKSVV